MSMTIRYNYLNLPDCVYRGDGSVKVGYMYDALGTKLRKYSNQGGNRDYVANIEYGATGVELIHTPEGVALRNSAGSYTYRYNNQAEVLQRDNYSLMFVLKVFMSSLRSVTTHSVSSILSVQELISIFTMARRSKRSLAANTIIH